MRRGARHVVGGAGLIAALAVASCSSPGPLTRQEFTEEANAICTESNTRIASVAAPDPADPELVADTIDQIVAAQRGALEDLDDLRTPEALESQVDQWLELLARVLDDEEAVAAAVRNGDPAAADAANADAVTTNAEAEAIATELGLDACTVAGTAPPPPATDVPATDVSPADPSVSTTPTGSVP
jgi:ABC-type enterochelin transport system substrate-binding protein